MVLTDEQQEEFATLVGERLDQIKDAIPYIETTHEAASFVIGSVESLRYLAEKLLSPDTYKIVDRHIDSEVKVINIMIERLRFIQ
jgi:hypothetical protein